MELATTLKAESPSRSNWLFFWVFILIHILIGYLVNELIFTEDVYRSTFEEQASTEIVEKMLDFKKSLWWLELISPAIFFALRILLTALLFFIGFYLVGSTVEISLK